MDDPAGTSQPSTKRGSLQEPHTAGGSNNDGEHVRQRVLSVKLDLRDRDPTVTSQDAVFNLLRNISWQEARYRNLMLRARWAEATGLTRATGVPHDVTKLIRETEKMDLSGVAYSAAEQEVQAIWTRHSKRILAGGPLPEWNPNAALAIRGHKQQRESGVWLTSGIDDDGREHFIAHLQIVAAASHTGERPSGERLNVAIPIALGTARDWQSDLLRQMVSWEVPIAKAAVVIKPRRHKVMLQLCYAVKVPLPKFGNRVATLGPIDRGSLKLRTECDTIDYSAKLFTLGERKQHWDGIRRRAFFQIGRHKGGARVKRQLLAGTSWGDWFTTFLHQWSREVITWLSTQGVSSLNVIGLENLDWPAFRFTQFLRDKGELAGISVSTEADLADPATARSIKQEIAKKRRKAAKAGKAMRELTYQVG